MFKNPEDVVVFTGAKQAPASLISPVGNHVFAFNPDDVKWNFTNNTVSRDTIGGRVVQLLSSRVEQMTVTGRAGSRGELQRLAANLKKIIEYQVRDQKPVIFRVPSRNWSFQVFIQNVSSLGWDYSATSYPYEITLLVDQDLTGVSQKAVEKQAIQRLVEGIGYLPDFHGGNSSEALATSEAVLNSMTNIKNIKNNSRSTIADADKKLEQTPIQPGEFGDVIVQIARSQLGVPYVFGTQQEGVEFDCSGFTSYVYEKATGNNMPHSARMQQDLFVYVGKNQSNFAKGDLIFYWFSNTRGIPQGEASHVAIYIGNGKQIDASSSKGEIVERNMWFDSSFLGAGRAPSSWELLPKWSA